MKKQLLLCFAAGLLSAAAAMNSFGAVGWQQNAEGKWFYVSEEQEEEIIEEIEEIENVRGIEIVAQEQALENQQDNEHKIKIIRSIPSYMLGAPMTVSQEQTTENNSSDTEHSLIIKQSKETSASKEQNAPSQTETAKIQSSKGSNEAAVSRQSESPSYAPAEETAAASAAAQITKAAAEQQTETPPELQTDINHTEIERERNDASFRRTEIDINRSKEKQKQETGSQISAAELMSLKQFFPQGTQSSGPGSSTQAAGGEAYQKRLAEAEPVMAPYKEEIKRVVDMVMAQPDYDFTDSVICTKDFIDASLSTQIFYTFPAGNGMFYGVSGGRIYFGGVKDGKMEGYGLRIIGRDGVTTEGSRYTYVAACEWSAGKPNGAAKVIETHPGSSTGTWVESGTVADAQYVGMWDVIIKRSDVSFPFAVDYKDGNLENITLSSVVNGHSIGVGFHSKKIRGF